MPATTTIDAVIAALDDQPDRTTAELATATGRHATPASDADSALVDEVAEALRVLARVERRLRQLASRPPK